MEKLNLVRANNIRKIGFDCIDKSSELYYLFKRQELTKEILLSSSENLFVIAFFYDQLYDIADYLKYLTSIPITNQSYNIIKLYSKKLSIFSIKKLFDSSPIQTVLKGEVYRICKIEIDDFSPFLIYGYCTSGEILLPNFENTFQEFVQKSMDFILLLDLSNERVSKMILKNISICFEYLISQNKIGQIINSLNFNDLVEKNEILPLKRFDKICKIFTCEDVVDIAISKFNELSSEEDVIVISNLLNENRKIYSKIKTLILEKIKKMKTVHNSKIVLDFLFTMLYYDFKTIDRDIILEICEKFSLLNIDEVKLLTNSLSYNVDNGSSHIVDIQIIEKIKNCNDFHMKTRLFAEFMVLSQQRILTLEQIIELPEKFFSYGLTFINTESAQNIKIFNENLLNHRLKESIYRKIDPHDFALYLIKRYKIFHVDLSEYTHLMDHKYKQMYGLSNLKWASDHIDELKDDLTESLYRSLKNSQFSNCLINIDYKVNSTPDKIDSKENIVLKFLESENSNRKIKFKDFSLSIDTPLEIEEKPKKFCDESLELDSASEVQNCESEQCKFSEESDDIALSNSNLLIQAIYDRFNEDEPQFYDLITQFKDSNDYSYALSILFGFTSKNKKIEKFFKFFKDSAPYFTLEYTKHKEIIGFLFEKFRDLNIFEICAYSINIVDLKSFISDFPYTEPIYRGLKKRIENSKNQDEFIPLVRDCVFSTFVPNVIVGSKLFSLFKSPLNFNLDHLLSFKKDEVVYEAIKQLNNDNYNNQLIPILLNRGLTDEISALICKKLDISILNEKNIQRIYSLFYLNPLNYVKYEIYKSGFNLDEHIVLDLIKSISTNYSESIFEKVSEILSHFEFTQPCYDQMVSCLETSNILFKNWVFRNLKTENISLPFFVKLCWYVCNEDDIEYVEMAIKVLRNGRVFDIIDKWSKIRKFERLIRRIYPLRLTNREFYDQILENCEDEDEKRMLISVYDL